MTPRSQYQADGFVVAERALSAAELDVLKAEAVQICRGNRGPIGGIVPEVSASDDEVMRRTLAIHFPHKASDLVRTCLAHPRVTEMLTEVIGPNVKAMQSMLFIKAAGKPGQAWHQDEAFIPTRDRSLAGAWIALDDATVENGCLWVIPGSHRPGVIWPLRPHHDPRYDSSPEAYDFPFDEAAAVPVEVPAGSVVVFNGYLLHRSLDNRAATGYRRALVNHYMSAESLLPWQGEADWRDVVLVAGRDPYEYKGIEDRSRAFVRLEGMPDTEH